MNGKKAKRLRRLALQKTVGKPLVGYADAKVDKYKRTTVLTSSTRDLYKQIKTGRTGGRYEKDKAN